MAVLLIFKALTLATLAVASTYTDPLGGPPFRLYSTAQATTCLNEVDADLTIIADGGHLDGVGLSVLAYGGTEPRINAVRACQVVERARALGMHAHPAMRLYETYSVDDIVSPSFWDARTKELQTLATCVDPVHPFVAFDVEDYGPTAIVTEAELTARGLTPGMMADRMAGFLSIVRTLHIGAYPLFVGDVVHQLIGDNAATLEIWTESTFPLPDQARRSDEEYRESVAGDMGPSARYRSRWPRAIIRAGANDSLLRNDGYRGRKAMARDHAPLYPWVWRSNRLAADSARICSREWYENTLYDSRNDIANAWVVTMPLGDAELVHGEESYQRQLRKYSVSGLDNSPMVADAAGFAPVPDGRRLEAVVALDGEKSYTMAITLRIDSQAPGTKTLFGRVRTTGSGNQNQWSVSATDDGAGGYVLELRGRNGDSPQPLGTIATGDPFRLTATWHRPTETVGARIATATGELGAATVTTQAQYDTYTLLAVQPDRDGVVSVGDQVIVSRRVWTAAEIAREAPGALWPWGR